ncbi:hypothetical protein PFISCL1PPCAC_11953, partial [Pristionchus fissidentatus]
SFTLTASVAKMNSRKRKVDDLLLEKLNSELHKYRSELNKILRDKEDFIRTQRRSSLCIDPRRVDDDGIMAKFAPLYQTVSGLLPEKEEHPEHLRLLNDIIQESIIVEWPRSVYGVATEVDQAPLILRDRIVAECPTKHPTMRVKIYALSSASFSNATPQIMETLFRCTLIKEHNGVVGAHCGSINTSIAGRLCLTRRKGTTGPTIGRNGKLIARQAVPDTHSTLISHYGENVTSTAFEYHNGVLCATFPEMGVILKTMVYRDRLPNRYAIFFEVGLNICGLIFKNSLQSLPFFVSIENYQTAPMLRSIIWSRMQDREHYDGSEPQLPISYGIIREACKQFVKCQLNEARSMTDRELLHFQAMLFLPKVAKCRSEMEVDTLERMLYREPEVLAHGSYQSSMAVNDRLRECKERLKLRLLDEFVNYGVDIEKRDFMESPCVSILDGHTELQHTPWKWLFRVTELIHDVGCEGSTKAKKQLSGAEEYNNMSSLYNTGVISLYSVYDAKQLFEQLQRIDEDKGAMMIRFCDENAGHLSFVYGFTPDQQLMMGSIAGDTIMDFKKGISEALMDEDAPTIHDRLVQVNVHPTGPEGALYSTIKKRKLFSSYMSPREIKNTNTFPVEDITNRLDVF